MTCTLEYIPEYLHTNEKPIIDEFETGEELYYRCNKEIIKKPYDSISLYDISHNRNFNEPEKFLKDDVLYNVLDTNDFEKYLDLEIVTLVIKNLDGKTTFVKEIISKNDPKVFAHIKLKHDPIPCMYPHSVFEISVGGVVVTRENYNQILNKKNRLFKNLRSDIRQELTSIIQTGNIDSSEDIEYIEDL